jgi:hypothetical protein
MFYFLYKTTHISSAKIYIGVHCTDDLDDDYLGSGKHLKAAIRKHGAQSFMREIIEYFDDEVSMLLRKRKLSLRSL